MHIVSMDAANLPASEHGQLEQQGAEGSSALINLLKSSPVAQNQEQPASFPGSRALRCESFSDHFLDGGSIALAIGGED